MTTKSKLCNKAIGRGMGGVMRRCRKPVGHSGRCSDMPFLEHLRALPETRKVAEKVVRDSLNTRGSPWPGARRNRQPRWTLPENHPHYATYPDCVTVAQRLTLYVYEMPDAPDCPPEIAVYLERVPEKGHFVCPICRQPILLNDFRNARVSKAEIETAHLDPTATRLHTPDNMTFAHRVCNIAQGQKSLLQFLDWIAGMLARHGYTVSPPAH